MSSWGDVEDVVVGRTPWSARVPLDPLWAGRGRPARARAPAPLIGIWLLLLAPLPAQKLHETCAPCHATQAKDFQSHPHFAKGLSCDACHGPSEAHVKAAGAAAPDRVAGPAGMAALCGACHAAQNKDYATSKHGQMVAERSKVRSAHCGTCHGAHAPRRAAGMEAQCRRCHAMLPEACANTPAAAAKVSCAGCHHKHTQMAKR